MPKKPKQDTALCKKIRETHDYYAREWRNIHKEGNQDVRFVAGDPWDPEDISTREKDEQKRPHLVFDEASQYINGFLGKARQQKRGVKVEQGDDLSDTETAETLQGRIYHLWHKSKGGSKTIGALQDAATRGYGFYGIGKRYSGPKGREQEPYVRGFDSPDCVLMDPNCKEYDASDAMGCFVDDKLPKSEFMRKYSKYKPKDPAEGVETVIVTEFWDVAVEVTDRFLWIDDGSEDGIETLESELPGGKFTGKPEEIRDERDVETRTVTKYICQMVEHVSTDNQSDYGVEVLEIEEWDDDSIPIIPVYGQTFYVSTGKADNPKKVRLSLIRRARDPMGLMNLAASAAAERVAMMPKTRWMMAAGQEAGHEEEYRSIGNSPLGYLLYEPQVDSAPGVELPPPVPVQWEPQLAPALELIQLCQNSIRSAVGQIASPELQKNDSGVAIKRLNDSGDNASFHLTDNYAQSLERGGVIMGRLILKTHDTDRMISIRSDREEEKVVRINARHKNKEGKTVHYDFTKGEYAYTISTGPSHDSQMEAIKEWATTLAESNPELAKNLMDLLTEMQNFGPGAQPLIDRLKKIIGPVAMDENTPLDPRATAELKKGQQMIDLLAKALQEAQQKIETEQVKYQNEMEIHRMDNAAKIRIAEIGQIAKATIPQQQAEIDAADQHTQLVNDAMHKASDQQHEIALKQMDQQHATDLQQGAQDHQAGMQGEQLNAQAEQAKAAQEAAQTTEG